MKESLVIVAVKPYLPLEGKSLHTQPPFRKYSVTDERTDARENQEKFSLRSFAFMVQKL